MTETEKTSVTGEELKRYLYAELNQAEKDKIEEQLFLDDELFYEAVNLENELVDRFAKGKLEPAERIRFEKSLESFPDRKQKVANAVALQTFIEDERPMVSPIEPATQTFWQKLTDFFTIKSPILGSAMTGVLLLFVIGGVFLMLDNRRKAEELARLQDERGDIESVWKEREGELQKQMTNSNQRLSELQNQLENKSDESDELIKTLSNEQQRIQQLQKDLEKIQREKNKVQPTQKPPAPEIVSIPLSPNIGNREDRFTTTSVGEKTKRIAINLSLPNEVIKGERLTILLNGNQYLQGISPRVSPDGKKSISLTIPTKNLPSGENKLTVVNSAGKEITQYNFKVEKPE